MLMFCGLNLLKQAINMRGNVVNNATGESRDNPSSTAFTNGRNKHTFVRLLFGLIRVNLIYNSADISVEIPATALSNRLLSPNHVNGTMILDNEHKSLVDLDDS